MGATANRGSFLRKQRLLDLLPDGLHGSRTTTQLQKALEDDDFAVTQRSVERELIVLESSGQYPLRRIPGKPAGWSWQPGRKPPSRLGMDDQTALVYTMLERFLAPLLPQSLHGQLMPIFVDARDKLASGSSKRMALWNRRVVIDPSGQPLLLPQVAPRV